MIVLHHDVRVTPIHHLYQSLARTDQQKNQKGETPFESRKDWSHETHWNSTSMTQSDHNTHAVLRRVLGSEAFRLCTLSSVNLEPRTSPNKAATSSTFSSVSFPGGRREKHTTVGGDDFARFADGSYASGGCRVCTKYQ